MKLETMPSSSTLSAPCYRPAGFAHGRRRHGRRWRRSSINSSRCGCWWRCAHACTRRPPFRDFTPPSVMAVPLGRHPLSRPLTPALSSFAVRRCSVPATSGLQEPHRSSLIEACNEYARRLAPAADASVEQLGVIAASSCAQPETLNPEPWTLDPAVPTLTSSAPPAPAPAQRCRRPSGHQPLPWVALSAPCSAVIDTDMPRHASVLQWRRKTGASAAEGRRRRGLWAVACGQAPPFADTRRTS